MQGKGGAAEAEREPHVPAVAAGQTCRVWDYRESSCHWTPLSFPELSQAFPCPSHPCWSLPGSPFPSLTFGSGITISPSSFSSHPKSPFPNSSHKPLSDFCLIPLKMTVTRIFTKGNCWAGPTKLILPQILPAMLINIEQNLLHLISHPKIYSKYI